MQFNFYSNVTINNKVWINNPYKNLYLKKYPYYYSVKINNLLDHIIICECVFWFYKLIFIVGHIQNDDKKPRRI